MGATLGKCWVVSEHTQGDMSTWEDSQPPFSLSLPHLPSHFRPEAVSLLQPLRSIPLPASTSCFPFHRHQCFPVSREDDEPRSCAQRARQPILPLGDDRGLFFLPPLTSESRGLWPYCSGRGRAQACWPCRLRRERGNLSLSLSLLLTPFFPPFLFPPLGGS